MLQTATPGAPMSRCCRRHCRASAARCRQVRALRLRVPTVSRQRAGRQATNPPARVAGSDPWRGGRARVRPACVRVCRRAVQLCQGAPHLPAGRGGRRGAQRARRPRLAGRRGGTQRGAVLVPHSGAAAGQPAAPGAHADAAGAPAPDALRCAGSNPAVYEHLGHRHTAPSMETPSLDRATQ